MKEIYLLALLKCKGIGNTKLYKFIEQNDFDFELIKKNIINLITEEDYEEFDYILEKAENEIKNNKSYGINIITVFDEKFPKKLYEISDPVLYLYYKGNVDLLSKNSIAIIGSRKANEEDLENAKIAGSMFSKKDIPVVSGLAIGVDTSAHIGVVNSNGMAIAVLPSDLMNITPKSNNSLADSILKTGGCLITEYPVGSVVDKFCFVKRDRIQSALSNVILVIKADEKSGTMIAVNKSLKDNKKVYQLKLNKNSLIKESIDLINEDIDKIVANDLVNIQNDSSNHKQIRLF